MSLAQRIADFWQEVRAAPFVPAPTDYTPSLPPEDADHLAEPVEDAPPAWKAQALSGRTLIITYVDSKRQASERQVICRRLEQRAAVLYLLAYCTVRQQPRSFRADRIAAIVDAVTGEVFEPGSTLLEQFAPGQVSDSPYRYGLSPVQFADFNAALNVLAFMARCDGKWHPMEAEAIEDFAASYWLRAEITVPLDMAEVGRHAARLSPDPEIFWASLQRCADNRVLREIIRRHVGAVIDADGVHHPHETYWGSMIDEFLSMPL